MLLTLFLLCYLVAQHGCSASSPISTWLHLTDLHMSSDVEGSARLQHLEELAPLLGAYHPQAILISGDLTHSREPSSRAPRQSKQEWAYYLQAVVTLREHCPGAVLLDVPGNHDRFDSGDRWGASDMYSQSALQGVRAPLPSRVRVQESATRLGQTEACPHLYFVALDFSPNPGLRSPNFCGRVDEAMLLELSARMQRLRNACPASLVVCFGHYPLSVISQDEDLTLSSHLSRGPAAPRLSAALAQQATLYLNGHLHDAFGTRLHRLHPPADRSQTRFAELESSEWKHRRALRLMAAEGDAVSFLDLRFVPDSTALGGPRYRLRGVEEGDGSEYAGCVPMIVRPPDGRYYPLHNQNPAAELTSITVLVTPLPQPSTSTAPPEDTSVVGTLFCGPQRAATRHLALTQDFSHSGAAGHQAQTLHRGQLSPDDLAWVLRECPAEASWLQVAVRPPGRGESRTPLRPVVWVPRQWGSGVTRHRPLPLRTSLAETVVLAVDWPRLCTALFVLGWVLQCGLLAWPPARGGTAWRLRAVRVLWLLPGPWVVARLSSDAPRGMIFALGVATRSEAGGAGLRYVPLADTMFISLLHLWWVSLPLEALTLWTLTRWRRLAEGAAETGDVSRGAPGGNTRRKEFPVLGLTRVQLAAYTCVAAMHLLHMKMMVATPFGWEAVALSPVVGWQLPFTAFVLWTARRRIRLTAPQPKGD